jgi:hypothetical protein
MSHLDISLCIVNWNGRDVLASCLASVKRAAPAVTCEIIVVDNGSTDGSAEMVAADFPYAQLIANSENRGFAHANNQAAAVSRGRYLLFLNNDTLLKPACLEGLVWYLETHPHVGMVGPRLIGRDGTHQCSWRGRPTVRALLHRLPVFRTLGLFKFAYEEYRRGARDADEPHQVDTLLGAAVCLRREVFVQHGGWDESFPFGLEDFDLSARVARTHTVVFLPEVEIVHLGRVSSRLNPAYVYAGVECGYARYLRKHLAGPTVVGLYKLLVTLNLPFALLAESVRAIWRRLRRGPAAAGQPHSELAPLWQFLLRGLPMFWRC